MQEHHSQLEISYRKIETKKGTRSIGMFHLAERNAAAECFLGVSPPDGLVPLSDGEATAEGCPDVLTPDGLTPPFEGEA